MPNKKKILNLKENLFEKDLAYIAGIIDGEGYLGLNKTKELRCSKITISYCPHLKIAMSEPQAVEFIKECFGGTIFVRKAMVNGIRYKDQYVWQVSNKSAIKKILILLLPYLKVKRVTAIIILDYISLRERKRKISWKNNYDFQETELYLKSKELLNSGGDYVTTNKEI
jgi:hypothetical protein